MTLDEGKLEAVFEKTRGQCHICRKQLTQGNYGEPDRRGSWEVDHSKPKSKGGTDHLNNLFPICTKCNREKGDKSARAARAKHGYSRPPLTSKEVEEARSTRALGGAAAGAMIGGATAGPPGAFFVGLLGAAIGSNSEPEAG